MYPLIRDKIWNCSREKSSIRYAPLTKPHLLGKGDDMAVSKNTRRSSSDTNEAFKSFFQNSQVSEERERAWNDAVRHAGTGTPPLRFPVYEHLYFLNVYAQKMVDLLKDVSTRSVSEYSESAPVNYNI
jgi:hypothetical protein